MRQGATAGYAFFVNSSMVKRGCVNFSTWLEVGRCLDLIARGEGKPGRYGGVALRGTNGLLWELLLGSNKNSSHAKS